MAKPNILYIHSHDTGRFIQPYGYPVSTPNLQRLAEEGVVFRQAFCEGPTCSPSRAALLTGQCPHANGMLGLAHRGSRLNDYGRHIVHTLRRVGYTSYLCGHQHIIASDQVQDIGYDQVVTAQADQAHDQATRLLDSGPSEPFFLSVGFFETHRPFPPQRRLDDPRYVQPWPLFPDKPQTREDVARYHTRVHTLDEKMGMVFDALDHSPLADRTLVVCTTDHGVAFPSMKCTLRDSGTGVMLILRGPGGATGGRVCDTMVSHLDLYPTLCDLTGAPRPDWLEGESLVPLLHGERATLHEALFSEINLHAAADPQRAVRTNRWKYIRRYGEYPRTVLPNVDPGLTRDLWVEHGWGGMERPREEIYDLIFDPLERNNLAGDPEYASVQQDLVDRLTDWMTRTRDPLLEGRLQIPVGIRLAPPDAASLGKTDFVYEGSEDDERAWRGLG